jgi:hypothetical protein
MSMGTETSKGKRKSRWHNSSAVEDKLKVIYYNVLVCGVLIRMASTIDSFILGPWKKCKLSLYRYDFKTSQILSLGTVPENLLLGY